MALVGITENIGNKLEADFLALKNGAVNDCICIGYISISISIRNGTACAADYKINFPTLGFLGENCLENAAEVAPGNSGYRERSMRKFAAEKSAETRFRKFSPGLCLQENRPQPTLGSVFFRRRLVAESKLAFVSGDCAPSEMNHQAGSS
jgi:hypothetical protein